MARDGDENLDLPAAEAARTRARDRRRTTRMVLDNAGVRRLLIDREARRRTLADAARGEGDPARQGR
ncbi:MAG TPA: hypothetical protein VFO60_04770 [Candidatus Dormibacteraeota bacterium]|nr:hypothetical protein [Candidatus Dormibacteraeota bacterium]